MIQKVVWKMADILYWRSALTGECISLNENPILDSQAVIASARVLGTNQYLWDIATGRGL